MVLFTTSMPNVINPINKQFYFEVIQCFRKALRKKRLKLTQTKQMLHHNTAPVHLVLLIQEFLEKHYAIIPKSLYLSLLVPADFLLFLRMLS